MMGEKVARQENKNLRSAEDEKVKRKKLSSWEDKKVGGYEGETVRSREGEGQEHKDASEFVISLVLKPSGN